MLQSGDRNKAANLFAVGGEQMQPVKQTPAEQAKMILDMRGALGFGHLRKAQLQIAKRDAAAGRKSHRRRAEKFAYANPNRRGQLSQQCAEKKRQPIKHIHQGRFYRSITADEFNKSAQQECNAELRFCFLIRSNAPHPQIYFFARNSAARE